MIDDKIKILLVEDNPTDVVLIKRQIVKVLTQPSIEVANTLQEVEEAFSRNAPDIILCDYNLPGFNGLDVLELVNSIGPETLFIFLTGTINDEELAANTILSGASGYILKKNMQILHKKLEPFFNAVVKNKPLLSPVRQKIMNSKMLVKDIERFLENFTKENLAHKDGMLKIQQDIARLKEGYDIRKP
ncbi:MAG: response regulator [Leeuwenhoekiella sp.]